MFPSSGEPEELSFCLGWGHLPSTLEEAMVGMEPNEQKTVRLTPEQAFGEIDQDLIQEVPRGEFDPNISPEPGDVFETTDDQGHPIYFVVKDLRPDSVIIDFNHPLAGKEVEFAITLKAVREATPDDLKGCTCPSCAGSDRHEH
jgi:FKBP-type peptidyl-prolyl cis-trans isomerase 2